MLGIDDLMAAISTDKDLASQLSSCTSPDEAVKLAKSSGYDISTQELLEAYKVHMANMSSDEITNVAGGKGDKKVNYYGNGQSSYN